MVKHIVLWDLREDLTKQEQLEAMEGIKSRLEALVGKIDGLLDAKVYFDMIDTCNSRILLDSTLESEEALRGYIVHPEHKLAGTYVKSKVANKRSADFFI